MITCCRFSIDSDNSLLCLCWKFWQLIITCYRFYIGIYFYILSWSYLVLFHSYWYIFHIDIFWNRTEETHDFRWKKYSYHISKIFIYIFTSKDVIIFFLDFIDWSITYIWYFIFFFFFHISNYVNLLLYLWSLVLFVCIWLASSLYL